MKLKIKNIESKMNFKKNIKKIIKKNNKKKSIKLPTIHEILDTNDDDDCTFKEEYISTIVYNIFSSDIGKISNDYETLITPIDKAFRIWILIYRGLLNFIEKDEFKSDTDYINSMKFNRDWIKEFTDKNFSESLGVIGNLRDVNLKIANSLGDNLDETFNTKNRKYYFDIYSTWVTIAYELNQSILIKFGADGTESNQDRSLTILTNFLNYIKNNFSETYGKLKQKIPQQENVNDSVTIDTYLYQGQIETFKWAFEGIILSIKTKESNLNEEDRSKLENIKKELKYLNLNTNTESDKDYILSKFFSNVFFVDIDNTQIPLVDTKIFDEVNTLDDLLKKIF